MVNEFDADRRLSAANPITDETASSLLPSEINEIVIARITGAKTPRRPKRVEMARVGFLGVLAACGFVLVALNVLSGDAIPEITPAIEATPVDPPAGPTTTVLEVVQATTLASSSTIDQAMTSEDARTTTTTTTTTATTTTTTASVATSAPAEPSQATTLESEPIPAEETSTTPAGQQAPAVESPPRESDSDPVFEDSFVCVVFGETRQDAIDAYQMECAEPRVDCDPFDGYWACASEQIGEFRP